METMFEFMPSAVALLAAGVVWWIVAPSGEPRGRQDRRAGGTATGWDAHAGRRTSERWGPR